MIKFFGGIILGMIIGWSAYSPPHPSCQEHLRYSYESGTKVTVVKAICYRVIVDTIQVLPR